MEKKFFTCTLLSDVILNHSAATEGNQRSLDFIPGNNFLGIVAAMLYGRSDLSPADKVTLFHSGAVRYGDAHVVANGVRTLRIPASMYYPKLKRVEDVCLIHHGYDPEKDYDRQQLKQCRSGFYTLHDLNKVRKVKVDSSFAIKSAYDSKERRSMDSMMYGYDSLNCGQTFAFAVEFDDEVPAALIERVVASLVGKKHIGRSRTAQYGAVEIRETAADCYPELSRGAASGARVTVYADGRLIFLDEQSGMPTFRPTARQLGLTGGEIDWAASQVRTFQYAPWNGKRQARDTDRCGIEKGSVFVVRNVPECPASSQCVGSYRNEGFGKVVYNPEFLEFTGNGVAKAKFAGEQAPVVRQVDVAKVDSPLVKFVLGRQHEEKKLGEIYDLVDGFVAKHSGKFGGEQFASQWGTIRSIATNESSASSIRKEIKDYLTHGVAADKWNRGGRMAALTKFMEDVNDSDLRLVMVNLAAEMAKKCSK